MAGNFLDQFTEENPFNIYIGWDSREDIAYQVAKLSIEEKSSIPVKVMPLKQKDLRRDGIYSRDEDKLASTEFTFTRFLVPHLNDFKGWALFIDCDFLFVDDIAKLVSNIEGNNHKAVMCAQHDYTPDPGIKMDGQQQYVYPRKNWSSMVLYNCEHEKNKTGLTTDNVNNMDYTGAHFHRFSWLTDDEIGEVSHEWNWLVGWYKELDDGKPKALHYTEGGPWFKEYKNCEYNVEWLECRTRVDANEKKNLADTIKKLKNTHAEIQDLWYNNETLDLIKSLTEYIVDPNQNFYNHKFMEKLEKVMAFRTAAISPDPEDFQLEKKGIPYDSYLKDFIQGSFGVLSDWESEKNKDNPLVIRGLGGFSRKTIDHCIDKHRTFYYIDTGYIQPETRKDYHRVVKNHLQHIGPIVERPLDRIKNLNWQYRRPSRKKQGYILIAAPREKVMTLYGEDLNSWLDKTVTEIKKYTDRPIVVREKPDREVRIKTDTIWNALKDAHCLVTYNSIAATEALLFSTPAIALAPNAASVMCNTDLADLEHENKLKIYTKEEQQAYLAHLSYLQFNTYEMRSGYAYRTIEELSDHYADYSIFKNNTAR